MIYIIVYVLHYYILPRKVFMGENCLEELYRHIVLWNKIDTMAVIMDILIILGIILYWVLEAIENIRLFCKSASSEESES